MLVQSKTPEDILTYNREQVLSLIQDKTKGLPSKNVRYNLLELIYKVMGFDLSADVALALVSDSKRKLIMAPAGGAKTTSSQIEIILQKLIRPAILGKPLYGKRVLSLVYNTHNVKPMVIKHKQMVQKLYASGIKGLEIDSEIDANTMHSFCAYWLREYKEKMGMVNSQLIKEGRSQDLIRNAFTSVNKKYTFVGKVNFISLVSLYDYAKETMRSYNDPVVLDNFPDVKLPEGMLEDVYKFYEGLKKRRNYYNYVDLLGKMYDLLLTDEVARARIQGYYDYIVVDEIQDMPPLMMSILKLITGENVPLLAIGDSDQAIYEFRGADVSNALAFTDKFEDADVYLFKQNRRCRANIVEAASIIIGENKKRYKTKIHATKEDGDVQFHPYRTEHGQLTNIVNTLESYTQKELEETVVCYRDRVYSILLAEMLEEKKIPFNIISGVTPFSHELYDHVMNILDILYDPMDVDLHPNLFKILPASRLEIADQLGWDASNNKYKQEIRRRHFKDIDFGKYMQSKPFVSELAYLAELSTRIGKEPLENYFDELFSKICKYYWLFKKENNKNEDVDNVMTERVRRFFNSKKTYEELYRDIVKRRSACRINSENKIGVTLSTFHGLKGLEYDRCFMTYMDEDIFPSIRLGTGDMDMSKYETLLESETRVCYVAITRARDEVRLYYPENNPSRYVKRLLSVLKPDKVSNVVETPRMNIAGVLSETAEPSDTSPSTISGLKGKGTNFLDNVLGRV